MSAKSTGKTSVKRTIVPTANHTDWKRVRSLSDTAIRRAVKLDPAAHPTDGNFWKKAQVVMPQRKQTVTIRLDADLLEWLRQQKGYQTRINAVLRTYMDAQKP